MLKQGIGEMLLEKGEVKEGIQQLQRAIAEEYQEGEDILRNLFLSCAYLRLGDAYREHGTINEARAAWKQALRLRERGDDGTVTNGDYLIVHPGTYDGASEILVRLKETAERS